MALPPRSTRSRRGAAGLGIALLLSGSALAYASTEVGSVSAGAASIGTLAITPATGGTDTTNTVAFTASAMCPATATNYVVTIDGGGFPPKSAAIGNTDIAEHAGAAIISPLGQTWNTLAASQKATLPLSGTATLTLTCTDIFGAENLGDFSGQVKFTPTTGEAASYEVAGGPGGSPSPAPSTGASPSPSPTPGGVSPSPSPSATATPTPTPSEAPSPSPSADPSPPPTATPCVTPAGSPSPSVGPTPTGTQTVAVTVSPTAAPDPCASPGPTPTPSVGGVGTGGDGGAAGGDDDGLPATGASSAGPLLVVAISLVLGGTVLIAAANAPARRPQEA